jgi:hypothetical protein
MSTAAVAPSDPRAHAQPLKCPRCRLLSLPGSELCDCGHNFKTGAKEAKPPWIRDSESRPARGRASFWSLEFSCAAEARRAIDVAANAWYAVGVVSLVAAAWYPALVVDAVGAAALGFRLQRRPGKTSAVASCAASVLVVAVAAWLRLAGNHGGPGTLPGMLFLWTTTRGAVAGRRLSQLVEAESPRV